MALLFFDGFDHCGNGLAVDSGASGLGKWGVNVVSQPLTSNVQARTGTYSLRIGSPGVFIYTKPSVSSAGCVTGAAFFATVAFSTGDVLQVLEGTAIVHLSVAMSATGNLTVKRGSTILATSTRVIGLNSWVYIELQAVIHDTAGSYEVHIDGTVEASLTASGVDTRNGGTGVWDRVGIGSGVTGGATYVDDFYLCDTSGSAPRNTFLGPVKVDLLMAQPDATALGSNQGLTPSTGTDHGAMVDEIPPNTTDYNSSFTVGAKDTYQLPSLALTGTILGIQTNLYASKSDSMARQVAAVIRAGGVDYDGASVGLLTTFSYLSEVRAQNPNTSAEWTASDITALQAGMKVTA